MAEIITKDCKEYHIWDKVNGVWNRLFFKTNAKSVEADDGKELQTKVGALNGITSDLSCEDESIAISAKAVNDSLSGISFGYTADGKPGYKEAGADTVTPFKNGTIQLVGAYTGNASIDVSEYISEDSSINNFLVCATSCDYSSAKKTLSTEADRIIYGKCEIYNSNLFSKILSGNILTISNATISARGGAYDTGWNGWATASPVSNLTYNVYYIE